MLEKTSYCSRAVPRLPNLNIAGLQQGRAFCTTGGRAVREQDTQARILRTNALKQHSRRARFTERYRMYPDQLRRHFSRLRVAAKTFFGRFGITRLTLTATRKFAAQRGLGQPHQQGIKTQHQRIHGAVRWQSSHACQTAATAGAGCANTLTCRPARR